MKKQWHTAAVVLAIAFITGFNITGIMPVLSMISEKYPEQSTSTVQLLQTIHYALLMAASLLVGVLSARFSKKKIVLAGVLMVGIFGFLPFFFDSFAVLMACRILIGFGYGLASPMIAGVIAEFGAPEKQAGYMGLNVVGMGIGAMTGNLLGGILAGNGLRFFYLIYLLAFAGGTVILALLPDTPPASKNKKGTLGLKPVVLFLSIMTFLHAMLINAYGTNISMYISDRVSTDPQVSGIATAVNAACAMCMGMLFSRVLNFFRKMTLPFAVFAAAAGFAALLFIPGMPGILIGSGLCGVSLSCFSAGGAYMVMVSVSPEEVAGANGIYGVFNSLGGLIAPLVLGKAAMQMGGNTPENQFTAAMAGMLILTAAVAVHVTTSKADR